MARKGKSKRLVKEAFDEVTGNVPSRVRQTRMKQGKKKARKMQVAIALDKARRKGTKVPRRKS